MPRSTPTYGLDTSVFVRLLTGHPALDFEATQAALAKQFEREPATELFVSNQVIGEAYITLQHFYKLSKADARRGILRLFSDGIVSPLNGRSVIELLQGQGGAGLLGRLIAQEYQEHGLAVLTNDKRLAKIPGVQLL